MTLSANPPDHNTEFYQAYNTGFVNFSINMSTIYKIATYIYMDNKIFMSKKLLLSSQPIHIYSNTKYLHSGHRLRII